MPLCMWLLNNINVAYCHIELDGGVATLTTASDMGVVFSLLHIGRTSNLEKG